MHGLLILDKPMRMSSAQVVALIKRRAGGKDKVGHAGTLDPLATGVLAIAIGSATKAIDRLMATNKRYRTVIDLSAFTTTDDAEGTRTEVNVSQPPTSDMVQRAVQSFTGEFLQKPPAFSAVKVGGRRAYAIARAGGEPIIEPRPVIVQALELVAYAWPHVELDIFCAKGFYVRSLARDLGTALGVGGHCASIRRTAVGSYTLETAIPVDQLPERITQPDLLPVPPIEQ